MSSEVMAKRKMENQMWFKRSYYQMLANEREAKVVEEWEKTWGSQAAKGSSVQPPPEPRFPAPPMYRIAPSSTGVMHETKITTRRQKKFPAKKLERMDMDATDATVDATATAIQKSFSTPALQSGGSDQNNPDAWLLRKSAPKTPRTPDVPGSPPPERERAKPEWWMKRGVWTYSVKGGEGPDNAPFGGRSLDDNIAVFRTSFAGSQNRYEHGYLRYFRKRNPYGGFCVGLTHGW